MIQRFVKKIIVAVLSLFSFFAFEKGSSEESSLPKETENPRQKTFKGLLKDVEKAENGVYTYHGQDGGHDEQLRHFTQAMKILSQLPPEYALKMNQQEAYEFSLNLLCMEKEVLQDSVQKMSHTPYSAPSY